jgi:predicted nucleic acid-binding protein
MIVLDTNVISELMRPRPDPTVVGWVAAQPRTTLYTTGINQAEILHGVAALPAGRRRTALAAIAEAIFAEDFGGRILSFSSRAAPYYAQIVTARRRTGNPIEAFDALIAAIAREAGGDVATRDVGGFQDCGLIVINPWGAGRTASS